MPSLNVVILYIFSLYKFYNFLHLLEITYTIRIMFTTFFEKDGRKKIFTEIRLKITLVHLIDLKLKRKYNTDIGCIVWKEILHLYMHLKKIVNTPNFSCLLKETCAKRPLNTLTAFYFWCTFPFLRHTVQIIAWICIEKSRSVCIYTSTCTFRCLQESVRA